MTSLAAALSFSMRRPLSVKSELTDWLGKNVTLKDGEFWSDYIAAAGLGNFTGKPVSVNQALKLATVWACVRLISETIATLPCFFYKKKADGTREVAARHDLYEILHNQPNADMTAVVFWEVVIASMLLWGNAYVEIMRRASGGIIGLKFLNPAYVTFRRTAGGSYEYVYTERSIYTSSLSSVGTQRIILENDMMHIPAFSTDGRCGLSPISYGANVMGTAIQTDKASAETFQHSMRVPGVLTTGEIYSPGQREDLRKHIKKVSDEGGVMVVEAGTGFSPLSFNPHDAELLLSRSWNVEEMCRWFKVDPAMVGHGGKDSNWGTGLEQKMLWFLTFTLRSWCVRVEQAIRKSLLTPEERTVYYAEFAIEGLLRADSAARSTFYSQMEQNGNMTRDEVRKLENLPPMGGNAAKLTIQSNMIILDDLGNVVQTSGSNTARNAIVAWLGLDDLIKKETQ